MMNPARSKGTSPSEDRGSTSKSLFRRVERALDAIEHGEDILGTIRNVAEYMTANFQHDLGILGGRIYRLDEDEYELVGGFGSGDDAPIGVRVSSSYGAIDWVIDNGLVVMDRNAPGLDQEIERRVGTRERWAAISVADGDYVIAFDVRPKVESEEDLRASLNIVRLAISQKLRHERATLILEDARRIQGSILPKRVPQYAGFDMAGASRPAEVVGGDFYDFIPVTQEMFDFAIADASGHGLPAALQVRDIYVGLRMGISRDFKITRTIERLNAIISRS
jgi:sigma-B regulation protein RsbU (phosphoserine phosphatase)